MAWCRSSASYSTRSASGNLAEHWKIWLGSMNMLLLIRLVEIPRELRTGMTVANILILTSPTITIWSDAFSSLISWSLFSSKRFKSEAKWLSHSESLSYNPVIKMAAAKDVLVIIQNSNSANRLFTIIKLIVMQSVKVNLFWNGLMQKRNTKWRTHEIINMVRKRNGRAAIDAENRTVCGWSRSDSCSNSRK